MTRSEIDEVCVNGGPQRLDGWVSVTCTIIKTDLTKKGRRMDSLRRRSEGVLSKGTGE